MQQNAPCLCEECLQQLEKGPTNIQTSCHLLNHCDLLLSILQKPVNLHFAEAIDEAEQQELGATVEIDRSWSMDIEWQLTG